MDSNQAAKLFDALASEIRLDIFRLLIQHTPHGLTAGDIADHLQIPANNLSFHLKTLVHANLIEQERKGRFLHCRVNLPLMVEVVIFLLQECCRGNSDQYQTMLSEYPILNGLLPDCDYSSIT